MKQFHRTSYSKNKGSEDIVYRSVTGDYSISQEAFLDSDPALRAEDYTFFKRWSDENYRAEDSRDAKRSQTRAAAGAYLCPVRSGRGGRDMR